jgi:predicted aldo/keto reductase-like oxidoreductase
LDKATRPGGALDAIVDARESGLTRFIGITGHGIDAPGIFLEALRRFNFDSILFPINFIQYANPEYRNGCKKLLHLCQEKDVGTMIIKSVAKGPYGDLPKTHTTWYRPFTQKDQIQKCVDFALSQEITGICTAGDLSVLPIMLKCCQDFSPMSDLEQQDFIASAGQFEPLFN